jgi:hypothetical protein
MRSHRSEPQFMELFLLLNHAVKKYFLLLTREVFYFIIFFQKKPVELAFEKDKSK